MKENKKPKQTEKIEKEIEEKEKIDEDNITETKKKKEDIEISEEKLEKIKDELKNGKQKSKSKPKNKKLKKDIIRNVSICIIVAIYFLFISLGVKTIPVTEYIMDLKTFAIFTVIIAVVIFEKAYKKDADYLALHGLEMVVVGIETLVLLNLYSLEHEHFNKVLNWITIGMIMYYTIKSVIIYVKTKINK